MIRFQIAFAATICLTYPCLAADPPKTLEELLKADTKALATAKPDFKMTAQEWYDQFNDLDKDGLKAAWAKYVDKVIEIEGEVSYLIDREQPPLVDVGFKVLNGKKLGFLIASCLPADLWKTVAPKSKTSVRGYLSGRGFPGYLFPCIVVGTDSKVEHFKASELAKEVFADVKAAGRKYKNVWCSIEGKFVKAGEERDGAYILSIEGVEGKHVECHVPKEARAKVEAMKPGQAVKVYGELNVYTYEASIRVSECRFE